MSDIDVLARTIYGEARNQIFEGQVAVAYVIKTRSIERNKSITDICLAPKQFSCWNQSDPNRKIIEFVGLDNYRFMTCFGIAALTITGQLENPAVGANHYYTTKNILKSKTWPPSWAKEMTKIDIIGDHTFLKG